MSRRKAITHADKVFAPKTTTTEPSNFAKELALAAPFIGFMLAGYAWMIGDIFGLWA